MPKKVVFVLIKWKWSKYHVQFWIFIKISFQHVKLRLVISHCSATPVQQGKCSGTATDKLPGLLMVDGQVLPLQNPLAERSHRRFFSTTKTPGGLTVNPGNTRVMPPRTPALRPGRTRTSLRTEGEFLLA